MLWVLVIAGIGGIFILSLFTRQSTAASLDLVQGRFAPLRYAGNENREVIARIKHQAYEI